MEVTRNDVERKVIEWLKQGAPEGAKYNTKKAAIVLLFDDKKDEKDGGADITSMTIGPNRKLITGLMSCMDDEDSPLPYIMAKASEALMRKLEHDLEEVRASMDKENEDQKPGLITRIINFFTK